MTTKSFRQLWEKTGWAQQLPVCLDPAQTPLPSPIAAHWPTRPLICARSSSHPYPLPSAPLSPVGSYQTICMGQTWGWVCREPPPPCCYSCYCSPGWAQPEASLLFSEERGAKGECRERGMCTEANLCWQRAASTNTGVYIAARALAGWADTERTSSSWLLPCSPAL